MPKTHRFRVTLKAGRNVVRVYHTNCSNEDDAHKWGKMIVKRKGFDDTLITIHVEQV